MAEFEDLPAIGNEPSGTLTWLSLRKKLLVCVAVLAGLTVVLCILALGIGVWLPDVIFDSPQTLTEATTPDGCHLRVAQYWNHVDFYTTEPCVTHSNGSTKTYVLDGDDMKEGSVPMTIEPKAHVVTVTLIGNRAKTIYWDAE